MGAARPEVYGGRLEQILGSSWARLPILLLAVLPSSMVSAWLAARSRRRRAPARSSTPTALPSTTRAATLRHIDVEARQRATRRRTAGVLASGAVLAVTAGAITGSLMWAGGAALVAVTLAERWQAYGGARLLVVLPQGEGKPALRVDAYDACFLRILVDDEGQYRVRVGRVTWEVSRDELAAILAAVLPHLTRDHTDDAAIAAAATRLERERGWEGVLRDQLWARPTGIVLGHLDEDVLLAMEIDLGPAAT